jgi:hypothetical protein
VNHSASIAEAVERYLREGTCESDHPEWPGNIWNRARRPRQSARRHPLQVASRRTAQLLLSRGCLKHGDGFSDITGAAARRLERCARAFDALLDGSRIREDLGFKPKFPRLADAIAAGA